jgi:hypothetical protein
LDGLAALADPVGRRELDGATADRRILDWPLMARNAHRGKSEMTKLTYRLRHPAWSWTEQGGSRLDKEEAIQDMADAADEIDRLEAALKTALMVDDVTGYLIGRNPDGRKVNS